MQRGAGQEKPGLADNASYLNTLEYCHVGSPADRRFQDTGIERSAALGKDIQWFSDTYGLQPPAITEDGPGSEYSR